MMCREPDSRSPGQGQVHNLQMSIIRVQSINLTCIGGFLNYFTGMFMEDLNLLELTMMCRIQDSGSLCLGQGHS